MSSESIQKTQLRKIRFTQVKVIYLFISLLVLTLATTLWANAYWTISHGNQLEMIKARGELRVTTINAPPSYSSDNGVPSGIDYELTKMFADYLGVNLKIEPRSNIQQMFSALEKNEVDILAAALMYNPDKMKNFHVSPSYYSVSQQLVYYKGNKKPTDLAKLDDKLYVSHGTAHQTTLTKLKEKKYPTLDWQASDKTSRDLLRQVANGTIKYAIADSVTIAALQRIYPQLDVAFDISDEEPVMWYLASTEDDSLYAAIIDFFSKVSADSTLAKLEEKYLGHMVGSFDYVDSQTFIQAIEKILPDYQTLFEKYELKNVDWRMLAAIAYQESHWDPLATSPTGVRGLMMLTRSTSEMIGITNRIDPEQSIYGGAAYLEYLLSRIPNEIPEDERIWFALIAYNMGFAHMQDTRLLTKIQGSDPNSWADVKKRLPLLTDRRYYTLTKYGYAKGYQAAKYIENIRRYKLSLDDYLREKERQSQRDRQEKEQRIMLGTFYPAVSLDLINLGP